MVVLLAVGGCMKHPVSPAAGIGRADPDPVIIRVVTGDYDQVWEDLQNALSDRGLTVSSVSHVGDMLERTGRAITRQKKIFARARVMEFCSAILSRRMMESNPHYIAFCPFQIMVYSLPEDENRIYPAHRRLLWQNDSGTQPLDAVENLLDALINEVVETQKIYQ